MKERLKRAWAALSHTGLSFWQRVQDALVLFAAGDAGYIINQSLEGDIHGDVHFQPDGPPRNGVYYSKLLADTTPLSK